MNVLKKQSRFALLTCSLLALSLTGLMCPPGPGPGNGAPTANAGADQTVLISATVSLSGSASTDPDGDTLTFAWSQTAGTAVTLSSTTTSTTTFTALGVAGALTFELSVNDGNGGTDTDTVVITVSVPPANCGNGILDILEDCDGTFFELTAPASHGTCRGDCTYCGNGTVDGPVGAEECDDGDADDTDACTNACQTAPPVLFVADFGGQNVVSFANPAALNGLVVPATNLFGPGTTGLSFPADIIVTQNGSLVASNFAGPAGAGPGTLTRYDNAVSATGSTAPNATLQGASTDLSTPASLTVNLAQDLVFVANLGPVPGNITVYSSASSGLNGNVAPVRTITTAGVLAPGLMEQPIGINFGDNDDLYVANLKAGADNVLVFANASTRANVPARADREIASAAFTGTVFDVFVDTANDRLFVVNNPTQILIFENASTLSGPAPVTPDFTLTIAGTSLTAIVVGSDGTGYIVDFAGDQVLVYNNIANLGSSTAPPDGAISATQMTDPIRAFLLEP